MPALHHRLELILRFLFDVEDAGGAGAEHPLVRVGGKKIDMLHGSRKRAHRLDAVHAHQHAARPQFAADRVDVDPVTGDVVARGERRHARSRIDQRKHILGVDAAGLAWLEVPEFNAFFLERHPRVDV